jgi:hypothetical protein
MALASPDERCDNARCEVVAGRAGIGSVQCFHPGLVFAAPKRAAAAERVKRSDSGLFEEISSKAPGASIDPSSPHGSNMGRFPGVS